MALVIDGIDGIRAVVGQQLGTSEPLEVTQERVNTFADATGDHQWIHTDPERAKDGPFGGTIAHGYLTLSLVPTLMSQVVQVTGISMGLNYGCNKVRFPSPLPVGSTVTGTFELTGCEDVPGGVQTTIKASIAAQGAEKPSCVAELVSRWYA